MCIIAIKNKGIELPNEQILETMFKNNSDGAGFMYAADNKVIIQKGYMTFHSFMSAFKKLEQKYNLTDIPIVMHFRIATSGQVDAGTCHPFPIASKRKYLRRQYTETDIGVVHNGIIPIAAPDNMSDTMQYIKENLWEYKKHQCDFYTNKKWQKRIEKEIMSKMAFLDSAGQVYTIGDFINDDGMVYSNRSYKNQTFFLGYERFLDYYSQCNLCPIDGYIVTNCGNLIDCEDGLYLIDKYGKVYEYDFIMDLAAPIEATAYTYESLPFYYNEKQAMYFRVSENSFFMLE